MSTTINAHEPIALSHLHAAACDLADVIANTKHAAVHLSGARRTAPISSPRWSPTPSRS